MSKSLVPVDIDARLERLSWLEREERELGKRLASLEERVRRFEDFERPAYESWIRLEMGPLLATIDELHQKIHERRLQAAKLVSRLEGGRREKGADIEVEARKRARLDAKRESRREKKREKKRDAQLEARGEPGTEAAPEGRRLVTLYRSLARRLHPDSPDLIQGLPRARILGLWMEVQTAYGSGNAERLLAILAWLGEGGASPAALSYGERMARVRAMTAACARLERKIAELEMHPGWKFEESRSSSRRKLRQQAARELEVELARTQDVLEQLEKFVKVAKRAKGSWGRG